MRHRWSLILKWDKVFYPSKKRFNSIESSLQSIFIRGEGNRLSISLQRIIMIKLIHDKSEVKQLVYPVMRNDCTGAEVVRHETCKYYFCSTHNILCL